MKSVNWRQILSWAVVPQQRARIHVEEVGETDGDGNVIDTERIVRWEDKTDAIVKRTLGNRADEVTVMDAGEDDWDGEFQYFHILIEGPIDLIRLLIPVLREDYTRGGKVDDFIDEILLVPKATKRRVRR